MDSDKIRQMFRDAADLRKMGPFDEKKAETEGRFAEAYAEYVSEFVKGEPSAKPAAPAEPQWKQALAYLAGVLQQMDAALPESKAANRAAWEIIAPAVQKFYEGEKTGKNEEPAE